MIHIDLYGVNMDKPVVVKVPINLIGTPIGVKEEGGVLNQVSMELEVKCLAGDIPNVLDINIDELSIGDTIIAESVKLDDTLELISSTDMLIVSVTVPMKEVVTESDEEEDGEDTGSSEGASEEASSSDSNEGASDNSGDQ